MVDSSFLCDPQDITIAAARRLADRGRCDANGRAVLGLLLDGAA
jgi:hypothetical protein